jgi:prolyl-tRNA synthetase
MRLSAYYVPTLKEDPTEADVVSHKLLVRAGMIRRLTSGIYSYLPLGVRALNKTAQIVREEMNRAGCLEVFLPMVQPGDLWRETGRWDVYGKELLRFKDRHSRDSCLGPTHEEVITDIVRREVRSYRQLPLNLYQVQTKFRDEIRPRFGLMRCREFIMKDGYSFDRDEAGGQASYDSMFEAYTKIFSRLGLQFRAVQADSGAIGGSYSHEFMVLAETGEDVIVSCDSCAYAANLEMAEVAWEPETQDQRNGQPEAVSTPGTVTIAGVTEYLGLPAHRIVKTLIYLAGSEPVAACVPGDRELNEVKLKNALGVDSLELADARTIEELTGAPVGFSGPLGLQGLRIVGDLRLKQGSDWVTGANRKDTHFTKVDLQRDADLSAFTDLITVTEEDPCPKCGAALRFARGIEVGHVFKLGTKYSRAMGATVLDESGHEKDMVMGCYGIGVSRVVAAAIEQSHDRDGIVFPPPIAPFQVMLLALNTKSEPVMSRAEAIHSELEAMGHDVLFDDREERPGVKFKDADLLGFPMQLILGDKGLKEGIVETKDRRTGHRGSLRLDDFANAFAAWREAVLKGWSLD